MQKNLEVSEIFRIFANKYTTNTMFNVFTRQRLCLYNPQRLEEHHGLQRKVTKGLINTKQKALLLTQNNILYEQNITTFIAAGFKTLAML